MMYILVSEGEVISDNVFDSLELAKAHAECHVEDEDERVEVEIYKLGPRIGTVSLIAYFEKEQS